MNIFFIIGTGRCGTQLLRNILLEYENIAILPETHFIVPLYDKYKLNIISDEAFIDVVDNVYSDDGEKWVGTILNSANKSYSTYKNDFKIYVLKNKIHGNLKNYIEAFFEFLYGKKYIFGDKTPHYGANLDIILKIWPEAKIIYLIRDGINTSLSMLNHSAFLRNINGNLNFKDIGRYKFDNLEKQFKTDKPEIKKALLYWKIAINDIDQNIDLCPNGQLISIKYEDLIYQTDQVINQIVNFLNLKKSYKSDFNIKFIIKPFSSFKKPNNLPLSQYKIFYQMIDVEMKKHNYPYVVKKNYNYFYEIFRAIFFYLIILYNKILKLPKFFMNNSLK